MSQHMPPVEGSRSGLRERKKLKTRLAIQEHALRLFEAQGYSKTTVEEIADAAEVSPSTFFRYFPTKEDVVLFDAVDPLLIEAYRRQPPELNAIQAMRAAVHDVFKSIPREQQDEQWARGRLVYREPELQSAWIADLVRTAGLMASLVAERNGGSPGDRRIQLFIGALMGAMLAAMVPLLEEPDGDFVAALNEALDVVEHGFSL